MWFKGDIGDATLKAKSESKLFMVLVRGPNDESQQMLDTLNSMPEDIMTLIKTHVIAVEILADSQQAEQFGQIFPFTSVPSTHIIGLNGVRSEQLDSAVSSEEFLARIKKVLDKHVENKSPEGMARKIEKAKQLIEENRIKKQKEEELKEKERERERIRTGKELNKARELKQQAEYKNVVDEIQKNKREDQIARAKVLAQIEADKAERKRRQEMMKAGREEEGLKQRAAASTSGSTSSASAAAASATDARIQLRYPDGSNVTVTFPATDPLENVRKYIVDNTSYRNFRLSTTFPKREFDESNMSNSLRELHLAPSAVLLVIMSRAKGGNSSAPTAVVTGTGGYISSLWYYLLNPLTSAWLMIKRLIPAMTTTRDPVASEDAKERKRATDEPILAAKRMRESKYLNKDGNIIRLKDTEGEDGDDGNTYNGNSTQQM